MSTVVSYPFILINLKTYQESMGKKAIELALISEKVSNETGVCIAVSPQTIDLWAVINKTTIPVFAQHIDPVGHGKFTGHILPEAVAGIGCVGTLISHSERNLTIELIEKTINRAKEVRLSQVVCIDTINKGKAVAPFSPDVIAIEPPELIGSGIPVSKARPEVVIGAVEAVQSINPNIKVLCGAGITSGKDVAAALRLGAEGVLVASGVVKAKDPYEKLMDLAVAMAH